MIEIATHLAHRPWPLPSGRWIMAQSWHDLLFAHWPVPITLLRKLIPESLQIDTFEGVAWLAVVPFRMSGVRLRATPALPWLSHFPELNVRTYVLRDQRPGVWFFSLDAANFAAVEIARTWFHLPYFRARMSLRHRGDCVEYASERTHRRAASAELNCRYRPIQAEATAAPGTLEYFLTERYCLYASDARGRLYRSEIHHQPWALQIAEAQFARNSMALAAGIELPAVPPLLHFSRRQDVVVWPPKRVA
jgi:uncharacterized protein YqjF (DUF2071 family)